MVSNYRKMEALFGIGFWDHVTLGVSHWAYDQNSVIGRNHSGRTESWWIEEYNKQLQARFVLEKDLDVVFIDSWSQQSWNLEDELQQVAFKRETTKLWDLFSVMDNFAFKTIQDVIEELYECNQLLDGSIEQLQKDMEDRVTEINLLNDTTSNNIRQNGIEIAKVRHLAVLNGEHISQNLKAINDNKVETENTIMDLKASINNVESTLEHVKTDLEASIFSVKANMEALIDSVKTDTEASIDLVKQDIQQNVAELASSIDVNSNSIEHASSRIYVSTIYELFTLL